MPFGRLLLLSGCIILRSAPLQAQTYRDLIRDARAQIAAGQWDAAALDLAGALDRAPYIMDSCWAYIWRGVLESQRGSLTLARLNFRRALLLHPDPRVSGYGWLDSMPPLPTRLFDGEYRAVRVFSPGDPDQPARWIARPVFAYPPGLRTQRPGGGAVARWIVDTSGRADQHNIEVLEIPDSALVGPLKSMLAATRFEPALLGGKRVRSFMAYRFNLRPPSPRSPVRLVDDARRQLREHRPDSALALIDGALDPFNSPTPAMQVYAELARGIAWHMKRRHELEDHSFDVAMAEYQELKKQGVDLAPLLSQLVDSVSLTTRRGYKHAN
jgi:hypothetical protein